MTLPYYASAEQIMRDRSELARKGIARGRSVIVLTFADGVLFVAENPSTALHKVSELYDRLGFAAVGKYNEFENLRRAGIVHADMRGYSYDRRDVTGRSLANGYAQTLGTIFTEQPKPYEVEICVAEVGPHGAPPQAQLYRITYDGSIVDEQHFVVMGGTTEPIVTALRESYRPGMDLAEAVTVAVTALLDGGSGNGDADRRTIGVASLEVAVLDQSRPRRAFRRIAGAALEPLLPPAATSTGGTGNGEFEQSGSGDAPGAGDTAGSD
ncbi:proteasome subunit alpha [Rhodococcus sp. SGAir0479]|uniref:proteasome subunit alpha n=1 Tax=Rhodococcus sp. SGAir0479 TaxID=2567884 RepID=UPI0010CD0F46|nr:proteasome subunit alpha [Rhodococcus sp. SGAir0479]QCQ91077.1 proteasome subunit alpha [Rhodococcus sp. SGAir0479]